MTPVPETAGTRDEPVRDEPVPPSAPAPLGLWKRVLLQTAGVFFTILALAGFVLPLVPTTPFLLVAAACFARVSPRLHRWLLSNRVFGPFLERWQRDRTVPRKAKHRAYLLVGLSFGVSIALVKALWLRLAIAAIGAALIVYLARLPTERPAE